jgi:hypothetical protein
MTRNASRSCVHAAKASGVIVLLLAAASAGIARPAHASSFQIKDIVTDDQANLAALGFSAALTEDNNLVNPWGVSFTPTTSPFWISDNGAGLARQARRHHLPRPSRSRRRTWHPQTLRPLQPDR